MGEQRVVWGDEHTKHRSGKNEYVFCMEKSRMAKSLSTWEEVPEYYLQNSN